MDISPTKQEDHAEVKPGSAEVAFRPKMSTDDMFVGWNPPQANEPNEKKGTKGIPRLAHKKSKTGCQRCRARRVKVPRPFLVIPAVRYQEQPIPSSSLVSSALPSQVVTQPIPDLRTQHGHFLLPICIVYVVADKPTVRRGQTNLWRLRSTSGHVRL